MLFSELPSVTEAATGAYYKEEMPGSVHNCIGVESCQGAGVSLEWCQL